jgi:adenosylmethionine-8-amino-7-oxononanoate aminotransferase
MKTINNAMTQRLEAAKSAPARGAAENEPEFEALVDEIAALISEEKLPEGFDLQDAAKDPELVSLMREYGAAAGIRIYAAEQRAQEAEGNAMERVSARMRERGALPKSTRGGYAAPAATNYRSMSSEAFRQLVQQMKKTARDGGKTRL